MDCKNCHKPLNDSQNFCDDCGAKIIHNRLTPKVLLHQINEQFLSIDNKFLQTFVALFKKPEAVIDGYIDGVRKKYIDVLTYYAIALTLLGFQMFLLKQFFPDFLESTNSALAESLNSTNNSKNPFNNAPDVLNDYQGIVFSVFMPFIAIGTWLMYIDKRKHNYTEHLVINLYTTSQTIFFNFIVFMSLAIFNILDFVMASFMATIPTLIYGAFVFKRLYNSSFLSALGRYIVAYVVYTIAFAVVFFIFLLLVIVYMIATGTLNL